MPRAASPLNTVVSRAANAQIAGVGTGGSQSYSLSFSATFGAQSPETGSAYFRNRNDESAYRFGLETATGNVLGAAAADNYGRIGNRSGLNDGHFVSATLTIVPEPGTLLLLGGGIPGLATFGRRRAV